MGLRSVLNLLLLFILFWSGVSSAEIRKRRQTSNSYPVPSAEKKAYQPPLLLNAPPAPVAVSAPQQNAYQPPISLMRSNEYQSPLNAAPSHYTANAPAGQPSNQHSTSQGYVLPNQPPPPSYSVQYTPPVNSQQSFSIYQQPSANLQHIPQSASLATSYSVHQQSSPRQILSDSSGLPLSTAERTYSTHSKVVGSSHVPVQAIHKAPASEIQSDKETLAKEKDNKNDEYVVYYYYYYDNDTTPNNNNLTLNFDDIPSLEAYDNDKNAKEPEKSASARTLAANVNSIPPIAVEAKKESIQGETSSSQPRSASGSDREAYIRADRPNDPLEETVVQPLKPVSNVFRYGSNEVPRFPVLPNFIISEVTTTTKPGESITVNPLISEFTTTQAAQLSSQLPDVKSNEETEDDDVNNVLDNNTALKSNEDKIQEEEPQTTTTTTTEPTTTTEITTTTTTEKPRRRPSIGGGRRRFNPTSSTNRNRSPTRSSSSTSTTTTTTTTTSTPRRSFGGNRLRPRPPIGGNRPRTNSRTTEASDDKTESRAQESTTASTTASRSRFTSASPRRFQSSRSRSQTSSTTSTTRSPTSPSTRSRPTSRPRPNLITRNRPPRPGFLRPRPGSEPEEPETTTPAVEPTEEETSPSGTNEEASSTDNDENGTDEDDETSEEETEEPTTTEGNRFSALFRPRNRNALGNRPRPVIGNRPSRS
ncbi:mucin-5AC-like [Stegodyphus dumicola]|uniref:mucin-5AC-like n=1 Tax=Stegodyphus dumicola TaxID=202533 RepID=UPI0015A90F39|nr:mucin-5AC-like [Stegodyphus dumicola]